MWYAMLLSIGNVKVGEELFKLLTEAGFRVSSCQGWKMARLFYMMLTFIDHSPKVVVIYTTGVVPNKDELEWMRKVRQDGVTVICISSLSAYVSKYVDYSLVPSQYKTIGLILKTVR